VKMNTALTLQGNAKMDALNVALKTKTPYDKQKVIDESSAQPREGTPFYSMSTVDVGGETMFVFLSFPTDRVIVVGLSKTEDPAASLRAAGDAPAVPAGLRGYLNAAEPCHLWFAQTLDAQQMQFLK